MTIGRTSRLVLFGLVGLGTVASAWFWWPRPANDRAQPPIVDLHGENDSTLERAIEDARARVFKHPGDAEGWGTLGKILLANGFGEDSRACFAEAARLDPTDVRWPYLHGLAEQPINPDAAVKRFSDAARLVSDDDPKASVVRWRFAMALMRKGQRQEAETILRSQLLREANNPRVLLALGLLAADENQLAKAQEYLLRCVENPLTRQRAAARLAALFQQQGHKEAAEQYRRQARELPADPEGPDPLAEEYKALLVGRRARLLRAEYLLRAGTSGEAVALLQLLLQEHPDEAEAAVKLGMALAEQGRYQEAEQVLRQGMAHGGDRIQRHYFLCVALYHQAEKSGNRSGFEEAAEQARHVLAAKPDHAFAHLYLGLVLGRLGKSREGLDELKQAVRFSPESTDTHLHLGEALVGAGQRKEGLAELDRAVELAHKGDNRPRVASERLRKEQPK